MIKIAICDDETVMCEKLKMTVSSILEKWKEEYRIVCHSSAADVLWGPLDFDLLFLDIKMPGIDGMKAAGGLRERGFFGELIFVTAFPEYMPDAFEVEAADYLGKPADRERLERTLKRVLKKLRTDKEESFCIRTANWCRTIPFGEIYYCEVMNRKMFVHTKQGVVDYYGKMREAEAQAFPYLIRCHRSYLVNPRFLREYVGGEIRMENGERIPVSKNYRQAFMERMLAWMEGEG
ncbi:MAG: response regulator transcription factor [Lachnospiraceae bacterium]|jgi:DNA-binding LytR/AlgR family response regulator|nr:response regulator transcription factor [Lachnospiraceae bacterium]